MSRIRNFEYLFRLGWLFAISIVLGGFSVPIFLFPGHFGFFLGFGLACLTGCSIVLLSAQLFIFRPRPAAGIPRILMLHSVNNDIVEPIAPNNSIRPQELATLIEHLLAAKYTFRTLTQAMTPHPTSRVIVLTFDDGFIDNVTHLLPILKHFQIPATCFVTDRRNSAFLSDSDIQTLAATGLIEFGGHTVHHEDLRQCSSAALMQELTQNRETLRRLTKQPVETFAYPSGFYNNRERNAVKAAGFRWAVTTRKHGSTPPDPLQLPRQIIPRGLSPIQAYLLATRGRFRI